MLRVIRRGAQLLIARNPTQSGVIELLEAGDGGGSGALVAEELEPVTFQVATPSPWPALADAEAYLPVGPIHLPKAGPYMLTFYCQMIGDDTGPDSLSQTFVSVEPGGVETPFGSTGMPVAADWPTTAWQAGHFESYGSYIWCVAPTDLYALLATSNQAASAPAGAPVTVRNRHLSALPL